MQELISRFDRIYIQRESLESSVALKVLELFPNEIIEVVDARPFPESSGDLSASEFSRSKRHLYLTPFRGQFFKRCPGSRPGLTCCNYFVLNLGLQCDMNCSYCYLQNFINSPVLTIYTNIEDALMELADLGLEGQSLRVGTGETIDSLSLDPLTLYSRRLIEFFKDYPKWTLEFKTKSAYVDQFLDVAHSGNVVVSWSINPSKIVEKEEHLTASLEARLNSAAKAVRRGFKVAFHIDPMIFHPDWQLSYSELVDEICARFTPEQIPYMSVGALRFQPEQRALMRERFGMNSYVTRAETFKSKDGKLRYDAELRQEMFSFVIKRFQEQSKEWRLFMCMETPENWVRSGAENPFKSESLADLFSPEPLIEFKKEISRRPRHPDAHRS